MDSIFPVSRKRYLAIGQQYVVKYFTWNRFYLFRTHKNKLHYEVVLLCWARFINFRPSLALTRHWSLTFRESLLFENKHFPKNMMHLVWDRNRKPQLFTYWCFQLGCFRSWHEYFQEIAAELQSWFLTNCVFILFCIFLRVLCSLWWYQHYNVSSRSPEYIYILF